MDLGVLSVSRIFHQGPVEVVFFVLCIACMVMSVVKGGVTLVSNVSI